MIFWEDWTCLIKSVYQCTQLSTSFSRCVRFFYSYICNLREVFVMLCFWFEKIAMRTLWNHFDKSPSSVELFHKLSTPKKGRFQEQIQNWTQFFLRLLKELVHEILIIRSNTFHFCTHFSEKTVHFWSHNFYEAKDLPKMMKAHV